MGGENWRKSASNSLEEYCYRKTKGGGVEKTKESSGWKRNEITVYFMQKEVIYERGKTYKRGELL